MATNTIVRDCAVCLQDIPATTSKVLPCRHELCSTCYVQWRKQCQDNGNNFTCPCCRYVIERSEFTWPSNLSMLITDDVIDAYFDPMGWTYYENGEEVDSDDSTDYDYDDELDDEYVVDENGVYIPRQPDPERDCIDYPENPEDEEDM